MNEDTTLDQACTLREQLSGDHWRVHPFSDNYLVSEKGHWTLSPKGLERFWRNHEVVYRCKKCNNVFGVLLKNLNGQPILRDSVCQHCDANILGKVYPKKRTEQRTIKNYVCEHNEEIDVALNRVISDNSKIVEDFKNNPKAIGRLIGLSKKMLPTIDGGELQARLIKLINGEK